MGIRAVTSLQLLSPPGEGRCGGTSGWSQLCVGDSSPHPCCTAAQGQLQKMMAGLRLPQNLTFESFLANGLLCEASFLLLQPTELGHSMWFGRLSPCWDAATQRHPICGARERGGLGLQAQRWGGWGGCAGMLTGWVKSEKGDWSVKRTWGAK